MSNKQSRRSFLKFGVSAIAAPSAIGVTQLRNAAADDFPVKMPPRSESSEIDEYCRMFPKLPAAQFHYSDLERLACGDGRSLVGMSAPPEVLKNTDKTPRRDAQGRLLMSATLETEPDDEENFALPAGYTYLGQFIDHDLTLNPVEHFKPVRNPKAIANLRSGQLDLDNLYGRGPADQPYMYEADGRRLLRGRELSYGGATSPLFDHPRVQGRAVIGDKRNDENVIVSQVHGIFTSFHNQVAIDRPRADFEELRRIVTWHYQWMILTDFLPRLVGKDLMQKILPDFAASGRLGRPITNLKVAGQIGAGEMPLEFVDAAYRAAHSAIRPVYRLNTQMRGTPEERLDNPGLDGRRFIFAASAYSGLNGFREYPQDWGIDWRLFFEIDRKLSFKTVDTGPTRVQASYKPDTSLVDPLAYLPEFSEPHKDQGLFADKDGHPVPKPGIVSNLALRDLLRSTQRQLPSGQDVARAMREEPIPSKYLMVGRATSEWIKETRSITDYGDSFTNAAPLWFYVLAEAQLIWTQKAVSFSRAMETHINALPFYLGPVGGRLIVETFVQTLRNDPGSVLYAGADWHPDYTKEGRCDMPAIITHARAV